MPTRCPGCGTDNPTVAKFCQECGADLARTSCAGCGAALPPAAKFCTECGRAASAAAAQAERFESPKPFTPRHLAERILTSKAALEGERKRVTVLFADMKGSLELLADRDPEEARRLIEPMLNHMIEAVHRYEGTVNQVMGDGIMALFGAPLAHEDHAVRACYAALAMQSAIKRYADEAFRTRGVPPLQIRVGLNSGAVVVGAIGSDLRMEYTAVGQSTHLAARMEQLAAPGTIRLTAETLRAAEGFVQVTPLGAIPVKGLAAPVEVFELTGAGAARTRLQAAAARGLSKFVGRGDELAQVFAAVERAGSGRGEVVGLVGEPGVGKSRLVWEAVHSHRLHGWLVLESGSVSYGRASAWRPVVDLLRNYLEIEGRDDARRIRQKTTGKLLTLDRALEPVLTPLLALLDVPPDDPEWEHQDPIRRRTRILDACKRLLLREAQAQPLLLVFEDLHWIDQESQALLDSLVESLPTARVLLLTNYRPEYQQHWAARSYYTQIRVDPLPPQSADELLDALLGPDAGVAPLRKMLAERTGRNPFFIEESVRTLVETGDLAGTSGAYRLSGATAVLEVPATVQAILAARIDRLTPQNKHLLQAASVIGKDVPYGLLREVAGLSEDELRSRLAELQAAEFLYEASLFPDLEYTFKHALTHEVVYGSLLLDRRKRLHARVLEAAQRLYAAGGDEQLDRLAHHAFQAEAWDEAFRYCRQAGERAFGRSANSAACAAFDHALAAAQHLPDTREKLEKVVDVYLSARLGAMSMGELRRSLNYAREGDRLARSIGDPGRIAWTAAALSVPECALGGTTSAIAEAERGWRSAMTLPDASAQAVGALYLANIHEMAGNWPKMIELLAPGGAELADEKATGRSGARSGPLGHIAARGYYVFACGMAAKALAQVGRFDEAVERGKHGVQAAMALGFAYAQGYAEEYLAHVYLTRGEAQSALALLEPALERVRHEDVAILLQYIGTRLGQAYVLSGQIDQAVRTLEETTSLAEKAEHMRYLTSALMYLGEAYSLCGRADEALRACERALELAHRCGQRGVEAWALLTDGDVQIRCKPSAAAQVRDRYRAALDLATELEMRPLVARGQLALGSLAAKNGDKNEARERLGTAVQMLREMGMVAWLNQAEDARAAT